VNCCVCGSPVPEEAAFCEQCGASVEPPAVRGSSPSVSSAVLVMVAIGAIIAAIGIVVLLEMYEFFKSQGGEPPAPDSRQTAAGQSSTLVPQGTPHLGKAETVEFRGINDCVVFRYSSVLQKADWAGLLADESDDACPGGYGGVKVLSACDETIGQTQWDDEHPVLGLIFWLEDANDEVGGLDVSLDAGFVRMGDVRAHAACVLEHVPDSEVTWSTLQTRRVGGDAALCADHTDYGREPERGRICWFEHGQLLYRLSVSADPAHWQDVETTFEIIASTLRFGATR